MWIENPGSTRMQTLSRRTFLESVGGGLYGSALLSLLQSEESSAAPSRNRQPSGGAPRAKSVIQLFMNGGPSQMDLFDPKPELKRQHGKPYFHKIAGEVEFPEAAGALMRSPFRFQQHGECGMWVSEVMPHLAQRVDDIAFIRSMHTTNLTHELALFKIHCGRMLPGLPSLGAWAAYGLGTENQDLPAYIVLDDPQGLPVNGIQSWQSGFLPPEHQGTRFRATGTPVLNLKREFSEPDAITQAERAFINEIDQRHRRQRAGQPRLAARIASYQLAARMQLATTDALDLQQESAHTQQLYGIGQKESDSYGRRCLIARRLVERGVRFVQLYVNGQIWDNHSQLTAGLESCCRRTDQPVAALLHDLKRRGLLDTTLVCWGGEMGRLPIAQLAGGGDGRDHNKNAFTLWMAGGGVKGGTVHGATDELGFASVEDRVSVPDWHATILHLLGLDHQELVFPRNGLDERLTGVFEPRVVHKILA